MSGAEKLLLDSRPSKVQWAALMAFAAELGLELPPWEAAVVYERFEQVRRRAQSLAEVG